MNFCLSISTNAGTFIAVEKLFTGKANPSEVYDSVLGFIGDGLGGVGAGKVGKPGAIATQKGSNKKIGIKKPPEDGNTKRVNIPCRRRRANGANCRFFDEDFKPDPTKRITRIKDNGPIERVQLGFQGRVEFSEAHIQRKHLRITEKRMDTWLHYILLLHFYQINFINFSNQNLLALRRMEKNRDLKV